MGVNRFQRLAAIAGLADDVDLAVALQHFAQHLAGERFVVHQEYTDERRVCHGFFFG